MSQANIPNITPLISVTQGQTIPLLLSSIALEELALAHIMNAEAEKLQFVLGTLTPTTVTLSPPVVSVSNLLSVNSSVRRTLQDVAKKEMLLQFKFENVLELISITTTPTGLTCDGCSARGGGNQLAFHVNRGNLTPAAPAGLGDGRMTLDGSICANCTPAGSAFTYNFIQGNDVTQTFSALFTDFTSITCAQGTDSLGQPALIMTVTGSGTAAGVVNGTSVSFTLILTTQTNPSLTPTFQLILAGGAFDSGSQVAGVGQLQVRDDCPI